MLERTTETRIFENGILVNTITRAKKVCSYAELDPELQEKAWLNDNNELDWDWWECTYEDFADAQAERGISVDLKKTFFELNPDGAAFTGDITDADKFLFFVQCPQDYLRICNYILAENGASFGIGNGYHISQTYSFEYDNPNALDGGKKQHKAAEKFEKAAKWLKCQIYDYAINAAGELCSMLSDEQDWLLGQECYAENADVNEWEYNAETGERL